MSGPDGDAHRAIAYLGRSGVPVSRLSLGTAPLAGLFNSVSEADAVATVEEALASGVTYFDTAPQYGAGRAEERLGRALRGVPRDAFVVSTKVGRVLEPTASADASVFADGDRSVRDVFDFSAEGVQRSLDQSLGRLGLDHVDIVYIHDPDDAVKQAIAETFPVLAELRAQGVVRAVGVGMNQTQVPSRFIRETDIDVVLVAGRYSLLDRRAQDELLPLALERGVSIVVGGALNSGVLADPSPDAHFDYLQAPPEVLDRARVLQAELARWGVELPAAALQFPARNPAVASVLVGCRSATELRDDVRLFNAAVPQGCWSQVVDWIGDATRQGRTTR